jgi:hypothetical protein
MNCRPERHGSVAAKTRKYAVMEARMALRGVDGVEAIMMSKKEKVDVLACGCPKNKHEFAPLEA